MVTDPEEGGKGEARKKKKKKVEIAEEVLEEWRRFAGRLAEAERAVEAAEGGFAFAFMEGVLVQAVREGWWLLLDEMNLAPTEVGLSSRLKGYKGLQYKVGSCRV